MTMIVVEFILASIFIITSILSIFMSKSVIGEINSQKDACSIEVEAEVIDLVELKGDGYDSMFPVFKYNVGEKEYILKYCYGTGNKKLYKVGMKCVIYVNEDDNTIIYNPKDSSINTFKVLGYAGYIGLIACCYWIYTICTRIM